MLSIGSPRRVKNRGKKEETARSAEFRYRFRLRKGLRRFPRLLPLRKEARYLLGCTGVLVHRSTYLQYCTNLTNVAGNNNLDPTVAAEG